MTETSGASIEPEVLQIWVNSMVAFSGGNYFDPNWAPSDDYNTNSRCKHPVVAQAIHGDRTSHLPTGTIVPAHQSITTVTPAMFAMGISSTGRSALYELLERSNTCRSTMDLAAVSSVIDGLSKVNGQFTPASIQALMFYMRSSISSVERSIVPNKDKWLIMMLQRIVDLIDRLGVLNDEARECRQFVNSTVDEMIVAQSTIPIELRRVVNEMVQAGSRKMEQARAIAEAQLMGIGDDSDTLNVLNSELAVAQPSVNDATVWNMRADGNSLKLWHSAITGGLDKVALWVVDAEKL